MAVRRAHRLTIGYFSGSPLFTVGLKFIPASFGTWLLTTGVQFLALNSNLTYARARCTCPTRPSRATDSIIQVTRGVKSAYLAEVCG